MKGHLAMYLILAALAVAVLSRPASAAGEMIAGGSVAQNLLGTLTGQFAPAGGSTGSFSVMTASGTQSARFN